MTREEVIRGLTSLLEVRRKYGDMQTMKDEMQCLEMAIKALEQQPCEDCISRKAVLEYIEGNEADLWHRSENELVCQDIKELPPVIPQQTGRWEMCEDPDGIYGVCSECGQDADFSHYGKAYCYCPNCGAKMEVEE